MSKMKRLKKSSAPNSTCAILFGIAFVGVFALAGCIFLIAFMLVNAPTETPVQTRRSTSRTRRKKNR